MDADLGCGGDAHAYDDRTECRVLIVDDDQFCRHATRLLFAAVSKRSTAVFYEVDTADSANDAFKKLASSRYHLILLDIIMPGQTGDVMLAEVHEAFPSVAVVVCSIFAQPGLVQACIRHGADDYIQKPIAISDIELIWMHCLKHQPSFLTAINPTASYVAQLTAAQAALQTRSASTGQEERLDATSFSSSDTSSFSSGVPRLRSAPLSVPQPAVPVPRMSWQLAAAQSRSLPDSVLLRAAVAEMPSQISRRRAERPLTPEDEQGCPAGSLAAAPGAAPPRASSPPNPPARVLSLDTSCSRPATGPAGSQRARSISEPSSPTGLRAAAGRPWREQHSTWPPAEAARQQPHAYSVPPRLRLAECPSAPSAPLMHPRIRALMER